MANAPQYAATPKIGLGQVTAANTNRDGTGTLVNVYTGGTSGSKILEVTVQGTGTTTAGMVRLYIYDGTNNRLFDEFVVSAITVGASTAAFRVSKTYDNLILPSSTYILKASTHNAETFNVYALGGDL